MKHRKFKRDWILKACLAFWVVTWLIMIRPIFLFRYEIVTAFLPVTLMIALVLTFTSVIALLLSPPSPDPKSKEYTHSPLAKIISALVVISIVVSTITAIRSLWFNYLDINLSDRFIFENIATGFGIAGIVLTLILSTLQKDIYWVMRNKKAVLDERELHERREVFEISYKLGTLIVLGSALWLNGKIHNVPAIIDNMHGSVPGHLYWIGINLAVTMFALPLVVASWKKKNRK